MFKQVQLPHYVDGVCSKLQSWIIDIKEQMEQAYPVLIGL